MVEFSFTHGELWMIGILALVILGLTALVAIVWYDQKLEKKIRKTFTTKPIRHADFLKGGAPRFVMECHTTTLKRARRVMQLLHKTMEKNGKLTLADYFRCFGEKCELSDEAWGWTSIPDNSMYALMIDGKYHVMMPELEALDKELKTWIDPELELKKRVPEVTLESLQKDIEMIKVSIGYDWNGDLREIPIGRIDDAEGDIHELRERMDLLYRDIGNIYNRLDEMDSSIDALGVASNQFDQLKADMSKRDNCLWNQVNANSEEIKKNKEYSRMLHDHNLHLINGLEETIKSEPDRLQEELDDLKRDIGDITEEVYSYRDLTDEMDKRFKSYHNMHVNTQNWFSRLEKEIEEMHRHIDEGTGKIKKLKKKLRRMEVGQTNGNQ